MNEALFELPAEKVLFQTAKQLPVCTAVTEKEYLRALKALEVFKTPLEQFFTDVMVNVPDEKIRANRLALLGLVRGKLTQNVADISQL